MTIAQKGRFALIKNSASDELKTGSLIMSEKELWDLVGDHGVSDKETLRFAMNAVYQIAEMMLEGDCSDPWALRIELLTALSEDVRYQKLVASLAQAIQTCDQKAVHAAQLTALCAVLMISPTQHLWPRDWDSPAYKTNPVWQPEGSTAYGTKSTASC